MGIGETLILGAVGWLGTIIAVSWLHHRETERVEARCKAWMLAAHLRLDAHERHLARLTKGLGELDKARR